MRDWAKLCRCVSSSPFLAAPDLTGNTSAELGPVPHTPPGLKNFTCWEVSSAAMDAIKKKKQAMKVVKEKENSLSSAELEVNALNRRVQGLEGDLETCEDKLLLATQKLDKAATAADDSDRMRKVLESRAVQDEDRM